MDRLPMLARPPRREATWWRPGLPVYPPEPWDVDLAELVLDDPLPCWCTRAADTLDQEDGAMRWTPKHPAARFPSP